MSLQETNETILFDINRTAMWVHAADKYLSQFNEDRERFTLLRAFAVLAPVIEEYADNLGGFVAWIKSIRDALPQKSPQWRDVQSVYRRVHARYIQRQRRVRGDKAMAKAVELYGAAPFHTRLAWLARLEHVWAKRRLAFAGDTRLSADERAELYAAFWAIIDAEIERGERIPKWEQ
jgi:hypothetical protein